MGAWEEIVDYTVPSNTTSVVLDNFGTITKDDFIKVVITYKSNDTQNLRLTPNSTSNTDFYSQLLDAQNNNIEASRFNTTLISSAFASSTDQTSTIAYIKISENNRYNHFSNSNNISSDTGLFFTYQTSTVNVETITSLNFFSNLANSIAPNTRIQIYRLAAEKVADITVTSNTTQVDITGLDIQKDSEYLLVTDSKAGTGDFFAHLAVNGNTTLSNYYSQRISANGSSVNPSRINGANFMVSGTNQGNAMTHTHIKLSNIGAYTAQSYCIRRTGSSTAMIENFAISSTAENITSITQLNLIAATANDFGVGTRLHLYKLY
jgi:hypothetical protein